MRKYVSGKERTSVHKKRSESVKLNLNLIIIVIVNFKKIKKNRHDEHSRIVCLSIDSS